LEIIEIAAPFQADDEGLIPFTHSNFFNGLDRLNLQLRNCLVELRAASMPDASWAVSGIPQDDPEGLANPRF
jgi:hypothetical protein